MTRPLHPPGRERVFRAFVQFITASAARQILDAAEEARVGGHAGATFSDELETWIVSARADIISLTYPPWPVLGIALADAVRIIEEEELEEAFRRDL